MSKLRLLLALIFLSQTGMNFANTQKESSYLMTIELCSSGNNLSRLKFNMAVLEENVLGEFVTDSIISSIKGDYRIALSPSLSKLVNSRGFHEGLSYCYGDSRIKKDIFFLSLITADLSGKLAMIATGSLANKGFAWLARKIHTLGKNIYYTVLLTATGVVGYVVHEETKDLSKQIEIAKSNIGNELAIQAIEKMQTGREKLEDILSALGKLENNNEAM